MSRKAHTHILLTNIHAYVIRFSKIGVARRKSMPQHSRRPIKRREANKSSKKIRERSINRFYFVFSFRKRRRKKCKLKKNGKEYEKEQRESEKKYVYEKITTKNVEKKCVQHT